MSYASYSNTGLWRYLVRSNGAGPVLETSRLRYRAHDWTGDPGQETCDCVLSSNRYAAYQLEMFPFWLKVAQNGGDGGDVLVVTSDGYVKAAATQDGGHPWQLYYFVGPGLGMPGDGRIGGWLIAGPDITSGQWNSRVCWLDQSYPGPYNPIGGLSPAYTRYRIETIAVPFRLGEQIVSRSIKTLISEHYSGQDPTKASSVERFWYGDGMGKIRWEIWDNAPVSPTVADAPAMPYGGMANRPLASGVQLTDVRHYTNLVKGPQPVSGQPQLRGFTAASAGWPIGFVLP